MPLRSNSAPLLSRPHTSPFPDSDERVQAAHKYEHEQIPLTDEEEQSNQLFSPNLPNPSPSNVKADSSITNDQQPRPRINDEQGLVSSNDEERHHPFVTDKRAPGPFKNEQEESSGEDETKNVDQREETSMNDQQAQSPDGGQLEQTFSRDGQDIDGGRDRIPTGEEQTLSSFDKEQAQASDEGNVEQCHIDSDKPQDDAANGQPEPAPSDDAQEVPVGDKQVDAPRGNDREEAPIDDEQGPILDDGSQGEVPLDEDQAYTSGDNAQQQVPVEYKQEHVSNVVAEVEVPPINEDRDHVPGDGAQAEIPLDFFGDGIQEKVSLHDEEEHAPGDHLQEEVSVKDEQDHISGDGAQGEVPIDVSCNDTQDGVPFEDNHECSSGCGAQEDMTTEIEQEDSPGDNTALLDDERHKGLTDDDQRQILLYKKQAQPLANDENKGITTNDQTLSTNKQQQTRANDKKQSSINEQGRAAIKYDQRPSFTDEDQMQPQNNQPNLIEHEQRQRPRSDRLKQTRTNYEQQWYSAASVYALTPQEKASPPTRASPPPKAPAATSDKQARDCFNTRRDKQAQSKLEYQPAMAPLTHENQQARSGTKGPRPSSTDSGRRRSLSDVTREVNDHLSSIIHELCTLSADRGLLTSRGGGWDTLHHLTGLGPDLVWLREECRGLRDNYRTLNDRSSSNLVHTPYRLFDHLICGTSTYPNPGSYLELKSAACFEEAKQRIDTLQASVSGLELIARELKDCLRGLRVCRRQRMQQQQAAKGEEERLQEQEQDDRFDLVAAADIQFACRSAMLCRFAMVVARLI